MYASFPILKPNILVEGKNMGASGIDFNQLGTKGTLKYEGFDKEGKKFFAVATSAGTTVPSGGIPESAGKTVDTYVTGQIPSNVPKWKNV